MRKWVVRDVWSPFFHIVTWMDTLSSVFVFCFPLFLCDQFFLCPCEGFVKALCFVTVLLSSKNNVPEEICSLLSTHYVFLCVCGVACVINSVDSTRERKCCFFHENIAAIFETIKMQPLWNSTGIIIIAWIFNCIRMMWVQTRLTSTHSWHIVGCSWLSPCRSETMEMVARVRFWRFTSLDVQHAVKLREVINKTPSKKTKIY